MLKSWVLISIALLSAGAAMAEEEGGIPLLRAGTDIKNIQGDWHRARPAMPSPPPSFT